MGIWLQLPQILQAAFRGATPSQHHTAASMCCGHKGCLEGFTTDSYRQACLSDEAAAIQSKKTPDWSTSERPLCLFWCAFWV